MFVENLPFLASDSFAAQGGILSAQNPTNPTSAVFDGRKFLSLLKSWEISLTAHGGKIRFDAPAGKFTAELRATVAEHRAELLRLLASGSKDDHGDAAEWLERITADGWILERADAAGLEIIDLQPCPTCQGIERWQDLAGGWHCSTCSPRTPTGARLRRRAADLRGRYPLMRESDLQFRPVTVPGTWPAAVPSGIIADPVILCGDCGRRVVGGQSGRPSGLCFGCWILTHKGRRR